MTNKADKGLRNGSCNRTACQAPGAIYLNKGNKAYYCKPCADKINYPGGRADTLALFGTALLCEADEKDLKAKLYAENDDFLSKYGSRLDVTQKTVFLDLNLISTKVGFPVKKIISSIRKSDVLLEYTPYLDNKISKLSIVGSAFPTVTGWRIIDNDGKTIFTASGFDDSNRHTVISFVFSYNNGKAVINFVPPIHISDLENYYHLEIGCSKEVEEAMQMHMPVVGKLS